MANTLAPAAINHVMEGSAKSWVDLSGLGSPAIDDSLNASSVTDVGTGNRRINFASAMSNANYSVLAGMIEDGNTNGNRGASGHQVENKTTALYQYFVFFGSSASSDGGASDVAVDGGSVLGDLA